MKNKQPLLIVLVILLTQHTSLAGIVPKEVLNKVMATLNNQEYEETLTYCDSLLNIYPNDAALYHISAKAYYCVNKTERALVLTKKGLKVNPYSTPLHKLKALIGSNAHNSDVEEVINDFNKAITDSSKQLPLIHSKIYFLKRRKKTTMAYDEVERLLKIYPSDYNTLLLKISLLRELGNANESLDLCYTVLESHSDDANIYDEMGFNNIALQAYDQAILDFSHEVSLIEKSNDAMMTGVAHNNLAYAKYMIEDYLEALEDINKSLEYYPDNSYAFRNKALIYIALDQTEKACINLTKASEKGFEQHYGNEVNKLMLVHCKNSKKQAVADNR